MAWIKDHAIKQNVTKLHLKGLAVNNDHPLAAVSNTKFKQKTKGSTFKTFFKKLNYKSSYKNPSLYCILFTIFSA